jgi:hypothetical protein
LVEEFFEFLNGVSLSDAKFGADLAEALVEALQAVAEELLAEGARPGVVLGPATEDVDGQDLGVGARSGVEGGVIVQTEVASEPVESQGHGARTRRQWALRAV